MDEKEISDRIYELSGGVIGGIATLITECAIEAIKRKSERITMEIINDLYENTFARF